MNIIPAFPAPDLNIIKWSSKDKSLIEDTVSLNNLRGKVILLDCWTYTCIFCLRTIPIIKRLKEKYSKYGLVVLSAHSYEYEFARSIENIKNAIKKYELEEIPVGFDIENRIWKAYGNMYWPKHILIDQNGFIRYEHPGYGNIDEFEEAVIELLEETGQVIKEDRDSQNPVDGIYDIYGLQFPEIAPEICVGYTRLEKFGNRHNIKKETSNHCVDNNMHLDNEVYLKGNWFWGKESITVGKIDLKNESAVSMKYKYAKRVNAIIGTLDGKNGIVNVKIDGSFIDIKNCGSDLNLRENVSYADISWPFIYSLYRSEKPETHEIEIIPKTDNIVFYTFVFG